MKLQLPRFDKTKRYVLHISEEAENTLKQIFSESLKRKSLTMTLSFILEGIGLGALQVIPRVESVAEDGTTTQECRQSGYEDGLRGEYELYLRVYGTLKDEFQLAYLQGYFEGSHIRNHT